MVFSCEAGERDAALATPNRSEGTAAPNPGAQLQTIEGRVVDLGGVAIGGVELRTFPPEKSLLAQLLEGGPDNSDRAAARARLEAGLDSLRQVAAPFAAARLASGEAGVLVSPPIVVR